MFYGGEDAANSLRSEPAASLKFKEPRGSNGFAIAGKLTESGNAMLLINPHTSFFFRGEIHVVSHRDGCKGKSSHRRRMHHRAP